MSRRLALAAVALALATPAAPPAAAQEALYGAQAPRDSAYLRIASTLPAEARVQVEAQPPQILGPTPTQRIGAYTVVEAVEGREVAVTVQANGRSQRILVPLRAGSFVTALLQQGEDGALLLRPWADRTEYNQLRARLAFYNALPGCAVASLNLASNGTAVLADVAQGTAGVRSVNPVSTMLQATCPGHPAAPVALEGLEAGGTYSIWLIPGAPAAFLTRDVITPWGRQPGG